MANKKKKKKRGLLPEGFTVVDVIVNPGATIRAAKTAAKVRDIRKGRSAASRVQSGKARNYAASRGAEMGLQYDYGTPKKKKKKP